MLADCAHVSPVPRDSVRHVSRLQELLSKNLTRGRDDAELDELTQLLDKYRRRGGAWNRVEIEGREAYTRKLDCGHCETVFEASPPRGALIVEPDGTEIEVPLSAVCHACCRTQADA